MKVISSRNGLALVFMVFMLAVVLAAGPALAEKPPWAGGKDKPQKSKGSGKHDVKGDYDDRGAPGKDGWKGDRKGSYDKGKPHEKGRYFNEQQRVYIHDYYAAQYRKGHCPPGLAKKHNGCMPPGQAKKWALGRPLPRGVIFYDLPPSVLVQLGPPPSHHRFVRVAQDILLIAVGTGMVVDAVDDLSWEFSR